MTDLWPDAETGEMITDGSALPQFDPETGKENRFSDVNHQKLHRFGWYPFSPKLAQKILEAEKVVVIPTTNPSYTVTVEKGDKFVAYRTNAIKLRVGSGGVEHAETVYVLGIKGKPLIHLSECGKEVT